MTEKNLGGFRQSTDAEGKPIPRARGGAPTAGSRAGLFQQPRIEVKAAARALYEGVPGATCVSVAKEVQEPEGTIRRWKAEGGWKPAKRAIQNLGARAGELANSFAVKMSDLGKPMSDEVAATEVAKELAENFAVDVRAQLLDRHRREWAGPRKLAYEAMKEGNPAAALDKGKLAKITAETLMLIQTGECRAYGMDQAARGADERRTVVVIDREGAETPEEPAALPGITSSDEDF